MYRPRFDYPFLLVTVLAAVAIFLSGVVFGGQRRDGSEGEVRVHQRTLVTAAHLGELEGYERLYVDEDTDYAIYVKLDYSAEGIVEGDIVNLVGTTAVVSSVSSKEFLLDVENISKIVPGVSGEPVYLNGVPIGFISGWNGAGALRCIFY